MPNNFSDIVAKENLSNTEKLVTLDRTGQWSKIKYKKQLHIVSSLNHYKVQLEKSFIFSLYLPYPFVRNFRF